MKILHVVPSYKPAYMYGGPVESIANLCESLSAEGDEVTIYTTTANGTKELNVEPGKVCIVEGVTVIYFKRQTKDPLHFSTGLLKSLYKNCKKFDVVHIHSWWNIPAVAGAWICKQKKVKTVLSPRGMLSEYILQNSNSGIKKWAHKLVGKNLLEYTLLHATSASELKECRKVIPAWKAMEIPNISLLSQIDISKKKNAVFTIVFLSRIHPKKGIELLFEAISEINTELKLKIAGLGEAAYMSALKTKAKKLDIEDKIEWEGWKDREKKFNTLMQADLFALTSYNENFGNVVVEALHVGTPVLITKGVALSSFVEAHTLGWVCDTTPGSVKESLVEAIACTVQRNYITANAPGIIKDNFSPEVLVPQYHRLYALKQ